MVFAPNSWFLTAAKTMSVQEHNNGKEFLLIFRTTILTLELLQFRLVELHRLAAVLDLLPYLDLIRSLDLLQY
jgi:hypothetical protein